MKSLKHTVTIMAIVVFILITGTTFAQVTASATATAIIVAPIGISNSVDMNFGYVAVNTNLGTVVLTPAGTRTVTGGVMKTAIGGETDVAAAEFAITGEGNYTYVITLPSTDLTITNTTSGGSETMIVNTFTSTPTTTGTLSSGTQTLLVGATLNVSGSQVAGTYISGTAFNVTVNYN